MNTLGIDTMVTNDQDVTMADVIVWEGLNEVASSTAHAKVCEPDRFDEEVGTKLALGRALRKLGRQLISDAYTTVHERDHERVKQQEATRKGLEIKQQANRTFQLEFAKLIEALHPGTLQPKVKVESIKKFKDFDSVGGIEHVRENLPG